MRLEFFRQKRFDFTHTRTTSPTAVGGAIHSAVTRVLSSLSLCDIQFYNIIRCVFFLPLANEVCEGYVFTSGGEGGLHRGVCIQRMGVCIQGGLHPRGSASKGRYGQRAGGTHPTGMHSYLMNEIWLMLIYKYLNNQGWIQGDVAS